MAAQLCQRLEDELSERLLAGDIQPGQRVRVDRQDGELQITPIEAVGPAAEEDGRGGEDGRERCSPPPLPGETRDR